MGSDDSEKWISQDFVKEGLKENKKDREPIKPSEELRRIEKKLDKQQRQREKRG